MSEKKYVYIICAGGHAKQVIDILIENNYEIRGVFDDHKKGIFYRNVPIIGTLRDIKNYNNEPFFCALGDNKLRKIICESSINFKWINCTSHHSYISPTVHIGYGNYIGVHTKILSDSIIGNFNIINDSATVTHDNIIGNYNHVAPNASFGGRVKIGNSNLIGTNATINPDVILENEIIIGSGGVVTKSLSDPGIYVGIPCKKYK